MSFVTNGQLKILHNTIEARIEPYRQMILAGFCRSIDPAQWNHEMFGEPATPQRCEITPSTSSTWNFFNVTILVDGKIAAVMSLDKAFEYALFEANFRLNVKMHIPPRSPFFLVDNCVLDYDGFAGIPKGTPGYIVCYDSEDDHDDGRPYGVIFNILPLSITYVREDMIKPQF